MTVSSKDLAKVLRAISRMTADEKAELLRRLQDARNEDRDTKSMTLKSVVLSRYPSIRAFAKAIGWSESKAAKTINHARQASQADMEQFINHFDLSPETVAPLFFGTVFC